MEPRLCAMGLAAVVPPESVPPGAHPQMGTSLPGAARVSGAPSMAGLLLRHLPLCEGGGHG